MEVRKEGELIGFVEPYQLPVAYLAACMLCGDGATVVFRDNDEQAAQRSLLDHLRLVHGVGSR